SYKYRYNSKEFQDELSLNLYDYGARNYDPALGRWMNIDPLAEHSPDKNPYHFCSNNPINRTDPTGMCDDPNCTHGAVRRGWDAIGRFFGGAWGHADNSKNFIKQNVVTVGPIEQQTGPMLSQDDSTPEQRAENKAKYDEQQFAINTVNNSDNLGSPYTQLSVMKGVADGMPQLLPLGLSGRGVKVFSEAAFAEEIITLNRATNGGGVLLNGNPSSAINSAMYYETAAEQGASIFRSISGGHMFMDGNKRTAVAVFKSFANQNGLRTVSQSKMLNISTQVATGQVSDVSQIAKLLIK
ncbi:RHS repeat-associated core domain-containing protein, partial [Flavobacterium restrictum]